MGRTPGESRIGSDVLTELLAEGRTPELSGVAGGSDAPPPETATTTAIATAATARMTTVVRAATVTRRRPGSCGVVTSVGRLVPP